MQHNWMHETLYLLFAIFSLPNPKGHLHFCFVIATFSMLLIPHFPIWAFAWPIYWQLLDASYCMVRWNIHHLMIDQLNIHRTLSLQSRQKCKWSLCLYAVYNQGPNNMFLITLPLSWYICQYVPIWGWGMSLGSINILGTILLFVFG